jgi:hypothetical protein
MAPKQLRPPPINGDGNGAAVAAFVLGVISVPFFLFFPIAILAIILGVRGRRQAFHGAPHVGLAVWGLGLGITSFAFFLLIAFTYKGDL